MTHYREIDISGMAPCVPASQPAPQLIWVELSALVIDERYQRPLAGHNMKAIARIAGDFRWSRFSPVLIAPVEGGAYAVIDGQHRAHAAALCGFEKIPAMVALVAPEEQALAFIQINTSQIKVRSHVVYRAALSAGEAWALDCKAAVEAAGCTLMTRGNVGKYSKKVGEVFTIELIRNLIEAGHAQAVTDGLAALLHSDGVGAEHFADAILRPWLTAVIETGAPRAALDRALLISDLMTARDTADRYAKENGKPRAVILRKAFRIIIEKGVEAVKYD